MNEQAYEERFQNIESVLLQITNSQRQLLIAQVIMADEHHKLESSLRELTDQVKKGAETVQKLAEKVAILADGQKHADDRIDALADMVRDLIDRERGRTSPSCVHLAIARYNR